ncbi:hypothetical protein GCM10009612_21010 [Streptomyces beijiangensis]
MGGPGEVEAEVPARYAAVRGGVHREFRHDVGGGFGGEPPGAELLGGEQPGEARAATGGGEADGELPDGGKGFGGFVSHVTQRGGGLDP